MSKFSIEIDCGGREASGYEDRLPWVSYGTIVADGNNLAQLLDSATVDLIDQDGGERGFVKADADWMQSLIYQEYAKLKSAESGKPFPEGLCVVCAEVVKDSDIYCRSCRSRALDLTKESESA